MGNALRALRLAIYLFHYFFELLDPADPALAEVHLDVAGEFLFRQEPEDLHQLADLFVPITIIPVIGLARILQISIHGIKVLFLALGAGRFIVYGKNCFELRVKNFLAPR